MPQGQLREVRLDFWFVVRIVPLAVSYLVV
jgi:hypothetical protein